MPKPHVEELDINHLGARLQSALLKMTGRRTVPNILINGKSVGGGDDMAALESSDSEGQGRGFTEVSSEADLGKDQDLTKKRLSHRAYPPLWSDLILPDFKLVTGEESPLKEQGTELVQLMERSLVKSLSSDWYLRCSLNPTQT